MKSPRRADWAWAGLLASLAAAWAVTRRRARQRLVELAHQSQRAQVESAETGRMRDHVLASASHDLKTPLASIKLMVHLLKRDAAKGPVPPDRLAERLDAIETNLNRISSMIGELLDVARLQSGKPVLLHQQDVDFVALVRKVARGFELDLARHRVTVNADEDSLVGCWDPDRLERVVQNLIGNGIKYSPEGGDVRLTLSKHGRWAVLTVSDEGLGIPAEDLPHIFEWFRRGRNVEHMGGSGVGLAGSKQIVEKHGGRMDVRSRPGRGTTFTVRLPLRPAREREDVRPEPPAADLRPPAAAQPGSNPE